MTNTSIVYQNELYDVDGIEYCEWEDSLDKVVGTTEEEQKASYDWITYRFLISKGIFVSEPTSAEPVGEPAETAPKHEYTWPDTSIPREDKWTQHRLYLEREKLLKAKELWLRQEEAAFYQKLQEKYEQPNKQFYHPNGAPYSKTDYAGSLVSLAIIILVLLSVVFMCVMGQLVNFAVRVSH